MTVDLKSLDSLKSDKIYNGDYYLVGRSMQVTPVPRRPGSSGPIFDLDDTQYLMIVPRKEVHWYCDEYSTCIIPLTTRCKKAEKLIFSNDPVSKKMGLIILKHKNASK